MDYGINIYLPELNSIKIAKDGKSVTVGGGINSKKVTDTLWAAGKQTGMSAHPIKRALTNNLQSLGHANASHSWDRLLEVATVGFRDIMALFPISSFP
jgi:hypothetical protein